MKTIFQRLATIPDQFTKFALTRSFFHLYRTQNLSSAALAISTGGSPLVKTTNAITALVSGQVVYVAAGNTAALTGSNLTTAFSNLYVCTVSAAGTTVWYAGNQGATVNAILVPVIPENVAVLGAILVQNATGSDFVPGTTALDTGSLTVTYINNVGPFFPVRSI